MITDTPKISTAQVREEIRLLVDRGVLSNEVAELLKRNMMLDYIEEKHAKMPTKKQCLQDLADTMEHYGIQFCFDNAAYPIQISYTLIGKGFYYQAAPCCGINADTIKVIKRKI